MHVVGGSLVPVIKEKVSRYPEVVSQLTQHNIE